MTSDETRRLLADSTPSWNQRQNSSLSSSANIRSYVSGNGRVNRPKEPDKPPEKNTKISGQVKLALACILITVVLERMTFYGLTANLVLFLNEVPYSWLSYHAISASFLFFGISYIMSLVGGWIADSLLGRFKTITLAYAVYLCSYIVLPFLAVEKSNGNITDVKMPVICLCPNHTVLPDTGNATGPDSPFEEPCAWLILILLTVIAAAAGILRANICPFGADQLVQAAPGAQLSFFNLFYWCVNVGSFLGLGAVAYIQQQESFKLGFIMCTVSLGVSAVIFILGRCWYRSRPKDGSILTNIFRIFREACRNRKQYKQLHHALHKNLLADSSNSGLNGTPSSDKISFLDHAKQFHGGSFPNTLVDDVKKLGMILAIFSVLIPYWLVYFQMQTTFVVQALHMKLDLLKVNKTFRQADNSSVLPFYPVVPMPDDDFRFAAAWFSLCDALIVILLLPLFDRLIYPWMARSGYPFTFTKRIVLGMLFAAAAMAVAGVVEQFRLKAFWPHEDSCDKVYLPQKIGDTIYFAADMSVLWQIPQYTLIGISEVFASVASLQFAVTVAPKSMKAVVTGIFYFFCGLASFMGVAFILALSSTNTWFNNQDYGNINCKRGCDIPPTASCHMDYYFYTLAGMEVFGLALFLIVVRVFHLNSDEAVNPPGQAVRAAQSRRTQIQRLANSMPPSPS